ncbi:phosphoribosylanthranilate isomerase [Methanococcus voltae]|uniref:N-(5'-phosphoribosyl)anthranilate isomerase n=1 Tax=Methanococcus voltae (strain ATCC BAA-1334 / A3) TaxID=456320 RepID=D7DSX5_METV3|nr:phosphoribosylanthranilate isomerase [Methanococcus voltae]MCS3901875.1 phosphoribosylanthranilate isomerase [Methanococcus voltae]
MFLKICGIKTLDELKIVEKYANATGIIVECESKRRIELETGLNIIKNSKIPVFAVSTTKDLELWKKIVESIENTLSNSNSYNSSNSKIKPHIQIHTDMDVKNIEFLKTEYDCVIMKSFEVSKHSLDPEKDAENLLSEIEGYEVDKILLDTGKGCGKIHDHRISQIISKKIDVVLAGGLNFENVNNIVNSVNPYGIDMSSGVEKNNRKDEYLIKKVCNNLKLKS